MTFRVRQLPHNLLFLALCFVYLWLVVEPDLLYHCFGTILPAAPLFATGKAFLLDRLDAPGGGILYVAGLLSQGYYYPWLGAAIIVLAALGMAELFRRHLALVGVTRPAWLTSLPAVAFFLIYSRYKHPLAICLTVAFGLTLSLVFERLALRRTMTRVAGYCLIAAFGFWMGGSGTLMVFAILTAAHALLLRRDWTVAILVLPASVAIVWVLAQYVFLIAPGRAFVILSPFDASLTAGMDRFETVLVLLLYGLAPLTVLLGLVRTRTLARAQHSPKAARPTKKHSAKERRRPVLALLKGPAWTALPIVLMAVGLYWGHDERRKPYVLSNYYSCRRQWDEILELGHRLPRGMTNVFVNHDILRAMYHKGRLPHDMFRFPLNPHALLLTHEEKESDLALAKLSDVFFELGHVNMAQKLASELLATKDHLGVALERLAWINVVRDLASTARIYATALQRDVIHRGTADALLHGLEHGFPSDQAAFIDRVRSCMLSDPLAVFGRESVDQTLAALLERNPRNKMAFEYLMACHLLTGKLDKIMENVGRLEDLGYRQVPPLYEEAILIYYASQRQKPDLGKIKISSETIRRYQRFVQIRSSLQPQNQQETLKVLIREFGASYFFYFAFGQVGQV